MIMHSFLLIGQSNMAGMGRISEAHYIDKTHIHTLRNGKWYQFFRPINPDREPAGVNLAESFAEAYAEKYGVEVGLIPCADGGSHLDEWQKGEILYDNAVNNARLAQRTSKIVGILWHQGEADANPLLYPTYRIRFEKMINSLRSDLDLCDVPVIIGELGEFLTECKLCDTLVENFMFVNEALHEIADNNDFIGIASSKDLTANPDNLHFSADGLYHFGLRYFDEFEKLRDPDKEFPDKPDEDSAIRTEMELL